MDIPTIGDIGSSSRCNFNRLPEMRRGDFCGSAAEGAALEHAGVVQTSGRELDNGVAGFDEKPRTFVDVQRERQR